jgi:hypothetical protein
MEAAPAARPVPTAPPKAVGAGAPRLLAALVGSMLAHLAGVSALLAALAGAYKAKRRLGIDALPGVDVLPDPQIEAWIGAVVDLFGR